MSFSGLPAPSVEPTERPRLRICLASVDVAGPYACGGVGAAFHGLALALARGGHDVTLLYVNDSFRRGTVAEWQAYFERHGVRFVHLPQPPPGPIWYGGRKEASLDCHRWLAAEEPFDVVHSPEWLGLPYYALVAKRLGLAFHTTTFCVGTHGPMRWSREGEERLAAMREDLVVDFMERRSVELADVVTSPSRYMLDWMRADGWRLPARSYVAQNVLDVPTRAAGDASGAGGAGSARPVRELVFFGRLDRRKGVPFFCDVVDRLYAGGSLNVAITFSGSPVHFDGKTSDDYIRARSAAWPEQPRIITDMSREEALRYLMEEGRLAVMPARADNLPCTVHECIQLGVPFLASDVGGTPELVAPADRADVLCAPDAERFAARLREIVAHGQRPARAAIDARENERHWLSWHDMLTNDAAGASGRAAKRSPAGVERQADPTRQGASAPLATAPPQTRGPTPEPPTPGEATQPFISVCIAHYERPAFLAQMLASLERQSYRDFEVIISDDGSTRAETVSALEALAPGLAERGWTLLRGVNRGPGAARHAAAEKARGEFLVFVDDDDVAEPHALATLVRAAAHTDADVLVPVYRSFLGDAEPHADTPVRRWFIPLGPALAASIIYPEVGGAMIFVRKEAYFACGGFPLERDADEDWELLLTLVLDGYDLEVVPEPLLWYRDQEHSRSRADNRFRRTLRRIALFERTLPLELRDLASIALVRLAGADDSEGLRRLERVRQVLDRRQGRKAATNEK